MAKLKAAAHFPHAVDDSGEPAQSREIVPAGLNRSERMLEFQLGARVVLDHKSDDSLKSRLHNFHPGGT